MMTPLSEWQNFYVIVGSSAGALTGLQFVVMALISEMPLRPGEHETSGAFAGPTIVHFVAVLLLASSLVMPWHSLGPASLVWALAGLSGVGYALLVVRRMRRQSAYHPVLEDWVFHACLPIGAYVGLCAAAILTHTHTRGALFGMGGVVLLLLAVGIHNAWDNVTYLVIVKRERLQEASNQGGQSS